ncbi:hypothetical protein [Chryseobacterium sp. 2VB]|uniref:hypothetical protein n=1 Tax=Chryseobacterium sp. 2VB TaxID=2502204 RepID=UPI0010F6EA2E|nr:hypothetical protein [Chryseobacterium sp. 2VB]
MKELEELTADIREKLPRLMYIETLDFTYYKCKAKRFREPMLNDVIQYLWKLVEEENEAFDILYHIGSLTNAFDQHCWNFNFPYLKDQSPELIKFLHSLIKTKQ